MNRCMSKTVYSNATAPTRRPRLTQPISTVAPSQALETWFDKLGVWLSGLCLIHCVGTVVLIAALPMLQFDEHLHESFHIILAVVLPLVALIAFIPGFRRHHDKRVIALGVLGVALIIYGAAEPYNGLEHTMIAVVTSLGSLALITAHMRNRRLNKCNHPHHAHC